MRIDEFVECYTPLEVEKLDERRKFENSPSRKNSMGKLGGICKEYAVGDKSKQEISAQKAAKIIQDTFVTGKTKFATCLAVPRKPTHSDTAPATTKARRMNSLSEKSSH